MAERIWDLLAEENSLMAKRMCEKCLGLAELMVKLAQENVSVPDGMNEVMAKVNGDLVMRLGELRGL